jgi:hypothetical protein
LATVSSQFIAVLMTTHSGMVHYSSKLFIVTLSNIIAEQTAEMGGPLKVLCSGSNGQINTHLLVHKLPTNVGALFFHRDLGWLALSDLGG